MYHHLETTKKKIVGRRFISAEKIDKSSIKVICNDGEFTVDVQGDCCSSSRFYDLIIPKECIGEEIIDVMEGDDAEKIRREPIISEESVYEMGWPEYPESSFECASIWDIVLKTKSGEVLLRHANDSNGYYDGYTSYTFK